MQVVDQVMDGTLVCTPHLVTYPPEIEQALSLLAPELTPLAAGTAIQPRWLALNLLDAGRRTVPDPAKRSWGWTVSTH